MLVQIFYGSVLLGACALLYILGLAWAMGLLAKLATRFAHLTVFKHSAILIGTAIVAVVMGHTVVVWIWAAAFRISDALPDILEAVYFSLVTYTTLGYGDLVLEPGFRIFGAMAAVTGLLNFGISTAFLVALLGRLLTQAGEPQNPDLRRIETDPRQ